MGDGHGPGGCSRWNEKKSRFCKMEAKSGSSFCGQHAPPSDERARCPHCKSYILQNKMEKHLKKCNIVKEKSILPKYFSKGLNVDDFVVQPQDEKWDKMKLVDFDFAHVADFVKRVGADETSQFHTPFEPRHFAPMATQV